MNTSLLRRTGAVASLGIVLSLSLAACGSDDSSDTAATPTGDATTATSTTEPANFGAGCAAVPADGDGSFNGMATAQVATAASANPVLSTLVAAVGAAGLGDTLNSAPAITVFAPANSAFDKIPKADLANLLKPAQKDALTKILTHHVVSGKLAPSQLAGEHTTLAGDKINIVGSGEDFTVEGKTVKSKIVCGNVTTANATVYIIDTVLTD
ncbi:MAG: beta-Ig-H3/fasciclin [Marmoricola sp.]|nr:beta-Ig-H3/fasciclin [Marmoricola sp.]